MMVIGEDAAIIAEMANTMGGIMDGVNMVDPTSDVGMLVRYLAPMVASVVFTWAGKRLHAVVSPNGKLLLSQMAAIVTAFVAGDISTLTQTLITVVTGVAGGLAGSKARDVKVGKTAAVTPADKAKLESCADFGNA